MRAISWWWTPNTVSRPERACAGRTTSTVAALSDDQRIKSKRAELLRDGAKQALKPVSLQQGTSGTPRKLVAELSSGRPSTSSDDVALWIRDGWNDDEKSVLSDARAAGVT